MNGKLHFGLNAVLSCLTVTKYTGFSLGALTGTKITVFYALNFASSEEPDDILSRL